MYEYRARVLRVVDGDTLHVEFDLGLDIHTFTTLRLAHVNTPELGTVAGNEAQRFVSAEVCGLALYPPGPWLTVRTTKDRREKYGRYLAEVELPGGALLHERIIAAGHGVPYEGGKR